MKDNTTSNDDLTIGVFFFACIISGVVGFMLGQGYESMLKGSCVQKYISLVEKFSRTSPEKARALIALAQNKNVSICTAVDALDESEEQ